MGESQAGPLLMVGMHQRKRREQVEWSFSGENDGCAEASLPAVGHEDLARRLELGKQTECRGRKRDHPSRPKDCGEQVASRRIKKLTCMCVSPNFLSERHQELGQVRRPW